MLTPRQRLAERLILGLRTRDGIPAALAGRALRPRARAPARRARRVARARAARESADGRARLTEAGFLLSDALFTELL